MYGAMPPSGTTNCDRSVFFTFLHEAGQDHLDKPGQRRKKPAEVSIGLNIDADLWVQSSALPQHGIVVRIPQKACIKYQICFRRKASRIRERNEGNNKPRLAPLSVKS